MLEEHLGQRSHRWLLLFYTIVPKIVDMGYVSEALICQVLASDRNSCLNEAAGLIFGRSNYYYYLIVIVLEICEDATSHRLKHSMFLNFFLLLSPQACMDMMSLVNALLCAVRL